MFTAYASRALTKSSKEDSLLILLQAKSHFELDIFQDSEPPHKKMLCDL